MTTRKILLAFCTVALWLPALAQNNPTARITASDAKNYIGQNAVVCGKVADTKIPKYGLAGHGKPVTFYLDQPEAASQFYFVAFGLKGETPQEVVTEYEGKQVCVSGQVNQVSGKTFILANDRSQIKVESTSK